MKHLIVLWNDLTLPSCINHVLTTVPSCPTHTPDVLDILVVKDFLLPVNLTVCSALSSVHFPVIVDLRGRPSFQTLPDRPCFEQVDWTRFQDHLAEKNEQKSPSGLRRGYRCQAR